MKGGSGAVALLAVAVLNLKLIGRRVVCVYIANESKREEDLSRSRGPLRLK